MNACSYWKASNAITPGNIAFINPGKTTKAEVLQRFGKPAWELEEERVMVYRWESMGEPSRFTGDNREFSSPQASQWAFCIAFDKENVVAHHNLFQAPDSELLKKKVEKWVEAHGSD